MQIRRDAKTISSKNWRMKSFKTTFSFAINNGFFVLKILREEIYLIQSRKQIDLDKDGTHTCVKISARII